ncbi:phenylacetate--CoA ligase family protein [Pontibacillus litoralis]|uniref:Phenylacetate-coenzyme A ligase n=1 Tax=Pontibacillus litoralis JSM 072002 TaxID=1385512 RepID=A0A0A5G831_9BACI|nr:AMP-binding protein [Pontibacillus litoralis]KGX88194.1 phenylacetate-CoA ligase [Pontibacillus litoralis JSM 072002]
MFLHQIESASRYEVEAVQLERLLETVEKVYAKVPFYKEKFDHLGVSSEDVSTISDVKKLPFTTKKDLRDHYPFGLFAADAREVIRIHASSGTSGKPTVVGYTRKDIQVWSEIVARALTIGGGQPGEILHNAYGYGLFTGGLGLHYGGEELGMATVPVSGGNTDRQMMLIEDFKPTVICSTPSYLLNIAEQMEAEGRDPRQSSLKYAILGAEPWSEKMRRTIEGIFDVKACDIYGLSEVMGPGVAMECHESQNGLHIAEDHFLVEVIDPDTLEPVPEGEDGELVFTSLTKEAFPIIRYRSGDIGSITTEQCKCGRTTKRMSRVKGRIDDMLIIRGVNVFPSEMEHYLLTVEEIAPHYQLHIHQKGSLQHVELQVEMTDKLYNESKQDMNHASIRELSKSIRHLIKNGCLISVDVTIMAPKSIPRSQGKAIRIVDRTKEEVKSG